MSYYNATVAFRGETSRAFDLAIAALTPVGFRVTSRDRDSLNLMGPGMRSTKQAPILGASEIRLAGGHEELRLEAQLGGSSGLVKFVIAFPLALGIFLGLVFAVLTYLLMGHVWFLPVVLVAVVNATLWLLLAPFLIKYIRVRTVEAVDALLHNIASVSPVD